MDLSDVSERELRDEIPRREKVRRDTEEQRRQKLFELYAAHIDTLLALVPEHDRTSCSDDNLANRFDGRCKRCLLLDVRRTGYWSDEDLGVQVSLVRLPAI